MMRSMQRVLVTGGAGFIGSRLVERLLEQERSVVVLDDLSSPGSAPPAPRRGLRFVAGDVRRRATLHEAARGAQLVLHLASVVGVDRVLADARATDEVARTGTRHAIGAARAARCPLVVFSTSEVTDAPRRGPRAVYARAKRAAEQAALAAARDLPVTIVRPFNVVGGGQSPAQGMVLPAFAAAALRGGPLPVHGDGRQARSFLHVDDFVETLLALLAATGGRQPPGEEIVEIGAERSIAIGALAERIARLGARGAEPRRTAGAPRRADRRRRAPDLGALRRQVAFAPRRPLDAILQDVLARA